LKDPTDSAATITRNYLLEQRDVFDILKMLFHIDITSSDTVSKERGKLYIAALPGAGYSLNTGFAATIGSNAGIYTDDIDSVNLSTFNFNPTYTSKRQILLPFQSNIWTAGNKYDILGNWIFYKYPEMTYGLGGHSSVSAAEQLDYRYLLYREAVLKSIFTDVYAGMGYDLDYHWDITDGGLPGEEFQTSNATERPRNQFHRDVLSTYCTTAGKTRSIHLKGIMPLSSIAIIQRSSGATQTGSP